MKNKRGTIIKITFLSILLLLLIALLLLGLLGPKYGFDYVQFFHFENKIVYENTFSTEEFSSIKLDTTSSDIIVKNYEEQDIKVVIYDKNDKFIKVNTDNNQIHIYNKGENFCIGFCYTKKSIEIYLPNGNNMDVDIHSTSGNVKVNALLKDALVSTTSGNVEIEKTDYIQVESTSGNIKIGDSKKVELKATSGNIRVAKSNSGNIKTTSGNIHMDIFEGIENSTISSNSGNVTIDSINDIYIVANTTSGDIKLKDSNRFSEVELSIKTTSGNIKVK